jgi:hypothetical protein
MAKLLTKKEMLQAGRVYNYYQVMEEYLDILPLNSRERSELKLSLTTKIEFAFARDDKKTYKALDKKMKMMTKEIKRRQKEIKKVDQMVDENFINTINSSLRKK